MSVIVIGHMSVDPDNVRKLWAERAEDFQEIMTNAKAAGAIHHRWGLGSDGAVIIDEWPDAESFQNFFQTQGKIAELMAAGGVTAPPEFEILEAGDGAPDEF